MQPKNAIRYYQETIALADEMGMDPHSEAMTGVKIELCKLFDKKMHDLQKAIDLMEITRRDGQRRVEELDGLEEHRHYRRWLLASMIRLNILLGEWYVDERVGNLEAAEERREWAVTAILKEMKRRKDKNIKNEDEGPFLTEEEIGGTFEGKIPYYLTSPPVPLR